MNTIIKRWKPILKELNIDENYWEDIALFCEKNTFKEKDNTEYHLPMALRILSRINLSKVLFTNNDEICKKHSIAISISREDLHDITIQNGIDVVTMVESSLIDELAYYINKLIDNEGGVVIYDLCTNIITDEIPMSPRILMESFFISYNVYRYKKLKKVRNLIDERR
jgi:hypothetical protein